MGNFEEVKKKIGIWQRNPDIYLGHGKGYRKMTIDDLALQIYQLKDAEFAKVLGDSAKAWHERLKEKDAECQARIEGILNWIEERLVACLSEGYMFLHCDYSEWQAFKKQEQVSNGH